MPIGSPSEAYEADELLRQMPRALMGGTRAMRQAGSAYLPPHQAEDSVPNIEGLNLRSVKSAYEIRRQRSVLYPFFSQAVSKSVGHILCHPIKLLEDVPERVEDLWENIDLKGNIGDVFMRDVLFDAIGEAGVSFILVDHPTISESASLADLRPEDRPYWIHLKASDILNPENWERVNGVPRFSILRVKACGSEKDPADEYQTIMVERERVFRRAGSIGNATPFATVEVHRKVKDDNGDDKWILETAPTPLRPHTEIPIVPLYIHKSTEFRGVCPFDHLAHLCVMHWQKQSDKDMTLYRIAPPVLHRTGCTKKEVGEQMILAAGVVLYSENKDARAEFLEHGGTAMQSLSDDLESLEARILAWSNEPHIQRAQSDTATGRLIDKEQARTEIQAWAIVVKDCIEQALGLTAMYLQEPSGGSIELTAAKVQDNRDVEKLRFVVDVLERYGVNALTVLKELQCAGMLSDDFEIEEALSGADMGESKTAMLLTFVRRVLELVSGGMGEEEAIDKALAESEDEPSRQEAMSEDVTGGQDSSNQYSETVS